MRLREAFIPSVPIAIPSVIEIVLSSIPAIRAARSWTAPTAGPPGVLQGDRFHGRRPPASPGRGRPLLDRDRAVQLEPPEDGREGEGRHPCGRGDAH